MKKSVKEVVYDNENLLVKVYVNHRLSQEELKKMGDYLTRDDKHAGYKVVFLREDTQQPQKHTPSYQLMELNKKVDDFISKFYDTWKLEIETRDWDGSDKKTETSEILVDKYATKEEFDELKKKVSSLEKQSKISIMEEKKLPSLFKVDVFFKDNPTDEEQAKVFRDLVRGKKEVLIFDYDLDKELEKKKTYNKTLNCEQETGFSAGVVWDLFPIFFDRTAKNLFK